MWSPGLVCPMFCHLVAPLVFPQDPQETGETRDDPQSIKTERSGAVGMEVEQVVYWPYIKYMLKIEVTTYPKAQSMHGIEV